MPHRHKNNPQHYPTRCPISINSKPIQPPTSSTARDVARVADSSNGLVTTSSRAIRTTQPNHLRSHAKPRPTVAVLRCSAVYGNAGTGNRSSCSLAAGWWRVRLWRSSHIINVRSFAAGLLFGGGKLFAIYCRPSSEWKIRWNRRLGLRREWVIMY